MNATKNTRKSSTSAAVETPLRCALYARQSLLKERKAESVERQLVNARRLADERGYTIVATHVDEGISAYNGADRPGFRALLDDVAAGRLDVVVAVHPDRLWRQPLDRIAFLSLAREAGLASIVTVQGGEETMGDADGEFLGDLQAILGKRESATIARRLRAKHDQRRRNGEWGGGVAPIGYLCDTPNRSLKLDPEYAPLVREAFDRMLAGQSLGDIARWLRSTGLPRFDKFNVGRLRDMFTTPSYAGCRLSEPVLRGNFSARVRQPEVDVVPGNWPALITLDEHRTIVALFTSRVRERRGPVGKRTLSRMLTCAECGTSLTACVRKGSKSWICSAANGGCDRVSIVDEYVMAHVLDELCDTLNSPEFGAVVNASRRDDSRVASLASELAAAHARLEAVGDMFAEGAITSAAEYRRMSSKITDAISTLEAELDSERRSNVDTLASLPRDGEALRKAWPKMTPEEQRDVVALLIAEIRVPSAHHRTNPRRSKIVRRY